jgi:hypothetical protein
MRRTPLLLLSIISANGEFSVLFLAVFFVFAPLLGETKCIDDQSAKHVFSHLLFMCVPQAFFSQQQELLLALSRSKPVVMPTKS